MLDDDHGVQMLTCMYTPKVVKM